MALKIQRKALRGEDGTKTFSVRIREDLLAKPDEIAARTGYTRNELINQFIECALSVCEVEEQA